MPRFWIFGIGRVVKIKTVGIHDEQLATLSGCIVYLNDDGRTGLGQMLAARSSISLIVHNAPDAWLLFHYFTFRFALVFFVLTNLP